MRQPDLFGSGGGDDGGDDGSPHDTGRTRTTQEAMDVLEAFRAAFIESARGIARELIERHGHTDTRAVRAEMDTRGLLDERVRDFWLGAVFNSRMFIWTGQWNLATGTTTTRGRSHAWRPVKVWTLRTPEYRQALKQT